MSHTLMSQNRHPRTSHLADCPTVFLSYFSLWICYETENKYQNEQSKSATRLSMLHEEFLHLVIFTS